MSKPVSLATRLGWHGFQQVPAHVRRECECRACAGQFPNKGRLWTLETLREPTEERAYRKWLHRLRTNSYCTFHAREMFAEDSAAR